MTGAALEASGALEFGAGEGVAADFANATPGDCRSVCADAVDLLRGSSRQGAQTRTTMIDTTTRANAAGPRRPWGNRSSSTDPGAGDSGGVEPPGEGPASRSCERIWRD